MVKPTAANSQNQITPEDLSQIYHIGLPTAKCILQVTAQKFIRTSGHSLKKIFKPE